MANTGKWIVADGCEIARRYGTRAEAEIEAAYLAREVDTEILVSCPHERIAFFVRPEGQKVAAGFTSPARPPREGGASGSNMLEIQIDRQRKARKVALLWHETDRCTPGTPATSLGFSDHDPKTGEPRTVKIRMDAASARRIAVYLIEHADEIDPPGGV